MKFKTYLENNIVLFDGAMGTQIQNSGLPLGVSPESYNINHKDKLIEIHKAYLEAGAKVISTNTFGASSYKLKEDNLNVKEVVKSAVEIAKQAIIESNKDAYIALDLGPVGRMMKPIGDMSFNEAYDYFKEQIKYSEGVDLVIIETLSDLNEARAAVLAVKENSDLPVIVSMTFAEDARTLTGTTPEMFVYTMEGLSVDALGVNCSLGPKELMPIVESITSISSVPVIVQANAGLPRVIDEKTVFDIKEEVFSTYVEKFIDLGVKIVGGCCGTGPEHIKAFSSKLDKVVEVKKKVSKSIVCSQTKLVDFDDGFVIIGERINPTGNKKLKENLREGNINIAIKEALLQEKADILDVNVGLPDIDEKRVMENVLEELIAVVDLPLQIDSSKSKVLEAGLRIYPGIGIINSLNGKQKSMDRIFPIVKKYGAMAICLTLDESGIPSNAEDRVKIAEKIICEAKKYGIEEERLIIDCLVLTVSAQQAEVMETIKAISILKSKYKVKTTLGISNVSYGMPNRKLLTRTFLTLALAAGLDSAIMDPLDSELINTIYATNVLINKDISGEKYINEIREEDNKEKTSLIEDSLLNLVLKGYKEEVSLATKDLLLVKSPLDIVNEDLIKTLDEVGKKYESKELFLPQLIRAAETIGIAFDVIKSEISIKGKSISKGKIVMATVKGDVHDIGKNLVKILIENYGYDVIDLGKDVNEDLILETVLKYNIKLVGLSALMTTTVISMEKTIKLLNEKAPDTKIFVGGAVLTEDYAKKIKANYYCKDAKASVEVAQSIFS